MALAPLLDPGNVIIDLESPLPGEEIAPARQIWLLVRYLISRSLNAVTPTSLSKACAACCIIVSSR